MRVYTHVFVCGSFRHSVTRVGATPCLAKRTARAEMERILAVDTTGMPKTGWTLQRQEDVTHRVTVKQVAITL